MDREARAEYRGERYADMVTRIGYAWFNNPHDAQDICQEVLFKAMERGEGFGTAEAERAWILRVAVNQCKNLKKSAWRRHTVSLEEGAAVEVPEAEEDGLLELVGRLPAKYREAVYLHYYEGYPVQEAAVLLGRSPALVSTHLARARRKLKDMIEGGERDGQSV